MSAAATPTIVVVGAGRVGTYLACKLARAGGRVLLKGTAPSKAGAYTRSLQSST